MTEKIRLENITKEFGDVTAVDGVTASFEAGAYTMILGPSGSGKSTLLRIIAGLETPTEGQVLIDGDPVTELPPRDRELSMVFQNLALWDHKTVRKNMEFGLKMAGIGKRERRDRVDDIAELLHIEDKLDANPAALSGGQQQRVALGRSLVRRPDVVLLDEPLASLDERLRLEMRTEIKRIQQETGTTFIHVTHNQEDSMTVADEILLIESGRVRQFGRPLELYRSPATEFVAEFIGSPSMNLIDATVDDGRERMEIGGHRLTLPEEVAGSLAGYEGGRVRIGIRPESILIGDGGDGDIEIDATVSIVETFGDYSWYYLDSDIDSELVVQSADEDVMDAVAENDRVTVRVRPDAIHLFDPRTGEALR